MRMLLGPVLVSLLASSTSFARPSGLYEIKYMLEDRKRIDVGQDLLPARGPGRAVGADALPLRGRPKLMTRDEYLSLRDGVARACEADLAVDVP